MGYRTSFLDNESYGAEDVSRIFSHIVSGGVVAYPENPTVAQSLDSMRAQLVAAGVGEYGGLEVTKTETGVKIGQGAGFFESGVCVEVDSEGIELDADFSTDIYVYISYENEFNRVMPYAKAVLDNGDILILAKITADGNVIDLRSYAKTKVIPNAANYYHDFTITHTRFATTSGQDSRSSTEYEMPHTGFKYLLLQDVETEDMEILPYEHILDITGEEEQAIRINRSTTVTNMRVKRTGNILRISSQRATATNENHTYYLTLV